ncbi:MAG TPA: hypothetical protein VGK99_21975 [Acidobacteriota bacterium]
MRKVILDGPEYFLKTLLTLDHEISAELPTYAVRNRNVDEEHFPNGRGAS